jgi:hypothetical protein
MTLRSSDTSESQTVYHIREDLSWYSEYLSLILICWQRTYGINQPPFLWHKQSYYTVLYGLELGENSSFGSMSTGGYNVWHAPACTSTVCSWPRAWLRSGSPRDVTLPRFVLDWSYHALDGSEITPVQVRNDFVSYWDTPRESVHNHSFLTCDIIYKETVLVYWSLESLHFCTKVIIYISKVFVIFRRVRTQICLRYSSLWKQNAIVNVSFLPTMIAYDSFRTLK